MIVCAAFGFGRDVVNRLCRGQLACRLAWLAKVGVTRKDSITGFNPG